MADVVSVYEYPRIAVWTALIDAVCWPLRASRFEATVGAKFVGGPLPPLSTDYVGWIDCEVLEVIPYELITISISLPRRHGPPTLWELRCVFFEIDSTDTRVTCSIHGFNQGNHDERMLLGMLRCVLSWIQGHASNALAYRVRRDLHEQACRAGESEYDSSAMRQTPLSAETRSALTQASRKPARPYIRLASPGTF